VWDQERIAMKAIVLSLVFVGLAQGTTFGVYTDPNACVQQDWSRIVPFTLPGAEPSRPYGAILGPVPGDPNVWEVPAGPFKREWALACDPEGDEVTIRYVGGTRCRLAILDWPDLQLLCRHFGTDISGLETHMWTGRRTRKRGNASDNQIDPPALTID